MYKIAFAGFRHNHITGLYNQIKEDPRFEIAGAFEENEEAKIKAEEKGVIFNFNSLDEILEDEKIEIVAIGDYYSARGQIAIKAMEKGKHIIADKPLCTSLEEAHRIRELANDKNLAVGVMFSLRSNKNVIIAKSLIDEGKIGKINNIIFEAQHPLMFGKRPSWYFDGNKQGGTINDIAVHGIDLVRRFTREETSEIIGARCWNFYAKEAPDFKDSAQFMLKMKDGCGVMGDVSYAAPESFGYTHPSYWHFRIWGEKGLIDFREGGDGVTCYLADETEPISISEKPNGKDYDFLDDYVKALGSDVYSLIYSEDTLRSTIQTLLIQLASDSE